MTDHSPLQTRALIRASARTAAAGRWLWQRIQTCWERVAVALLRAEARIMENFRVPPGGG